MVKMSMISTEPYNTFDVRKKNPNSFKHFPGACT